MKKKDILTIVIGDIVLIVILLVWSLWPNQSKEAQAQACIGYQLVAANSNPPGCPAGWALVPAGGSVNSGIAYCDAYGCYPRFVGLCWGPA